MSNVTYLPNRKKDAKIVNHYEQFKRIEELERENFVLKQAHRREVVSLDRWRIGLLWVIVGLILVGHF